MNSSTDSYPSIQICSLGAAQEIDHSTYDGVITIEDSLVDDPLRIDESDCPQLVLCFDDIASPKDEWILPKERHVRSALEFADELGGGSLLIHCHAGISRSSGIALAIIAKGLGPGREKQAFIELEKINPYVTQGSNAQARTTTSDRTRNQEGKACGQALRPLRRKRARIGP